MRASHALLISIVLLVTLWLYGLQAPVSAVPLETANPPGAGQVLPIPIE